jgi:uncharacterized membrane protein YgdD (TMEM256/DUF423 family)
MDRRWISLAAVLIALGVALGAFGAHALESRLEPDALDTYMTANRYHVWHALGMLVLAFFAGRQLVGVLWLLLAGLVLFSGSLYALAMTGVGWLGAITPLGGVSWIIAWLWLAFAARRLVAQETE